MIHGYKPPQFTDEDVADLALGTRLRLPSPFLDALELDVRPLSEAEIEEARLEARAQVRFRLAQRGLGADLGGSLEGRAFERCILARAVLCPGDPASRPFFANAAAVEELDPSTVSTLFETFTRARERSAPAHDEADVKEIVKALAAQRAPLDAARARHAPELCAFYGVASVRELTDWQTIRFLKLSETSA